MPGPGDAPHAVEGRWQEDGVRITLTEPGAAFEVVAAGDGELRIRPT